MTIGKPDGFETRPHHCRRTGVMRPVELTRSGLFTEDVLTRHCDAWLLPLLEGTVRPVGRAVARVDKPHILAAISNCSLVKENCMPPQGRNAGSGMVAKSDGLSTHLLERISNVEKLPVRSWPDRIHEAGDLESQAFIKKALVSCLPRRSPQRRPIGPRPSTVVLGP